MILIPINRNYFTGLKKMLDIKFIRQNSQKVKKGCAKKQVKVDIDRLLELDKQRRETMVILDGFRAKKNKASKDIVAAKDKKAQKKIISEMRKIDKQSDKTKKQFQKIDKQYKELIFQIPNLPFDDVPVGKDENDNVVLKEIGEKTKFDFKPKDHLELGEALDIIDVKRASKISGSRFSFLKKEGALLELAMMNLAIDFLSKKGFSLLIPPVMLKKEIAKGTGYFESADENEAYFIPKDDMYLVGTSEQSILTMHADEIFEEKELPKRYIGLSTCFRREAGAYGKDTKGILRVHQFNKLEMFSFCKPEDSAKENKFFLELEEKLMQKLKLPYQVVNICTGDLGFPAAVKYDIETWMPGQNKYRETHSTSNCTDFQARRLNIRYRNSKSKKLEFVHTVNGTAFAIGRTLIAIIENYQQKDGSVLIPKVLQKYIGKEKICHKVKEKQF